MNMVYSYLKDHELLVNYVLHSSFMAQTIWYPRLSKIKSNQVKEHVQKEHVTIKQALIKLLK